jgi:hypothetical protein
MYVASSADGTKLVASISWMNIYSSKDSGNSWERFSIPNKMWGAMALSSDGAKIAAVTSGEGIYVSSMSAPTPAPTEKPIANPTNTPTATPTDKPTATPTDKPIATPTDMPTETPTAIPTAPSNICIIGIASTSCIYI